MPISPATQLLADTLSDRIRSNSRIKVKVESINIPLPMINNNNRTPSRIPNSSLCIRRYTPKPSWFRISRDTFMGSQIYTRVSQIIELVDIVQC